MPPFVVTTSADVVDVNDGFVSLREAVALANANADSDTITFAAALEGSTITLGSGPLALTSDIIMDGDITGDNRADIVISGGNAGSILDISGAGTDVDLLSLTLAGGATFGSGGAISIVGGTLDISDTTIRNSSAGSNATTGGGAIYASGATLTMTNSLLTGNSSGGQSGGAILMQGGTATLTNTTIHANTANGSNFNTFGSGGGISANSTATVTLVNSTVTNNTASGAVSSSGGGISIGGTLNLINTVVADNTAGSLANVQGTINTNTNNFIGINPGLNLLFDNGGTTLTQSIRTNSPLINAGSNGALGVPVLDANGNDRTVGTVDIGATERQIMVTNTLDSGAGSLRQAIIDANANADFSVIQFDGLLSGQTFNVGALGQLNIASDIRIDGDMNGDNKADVTISGGDARRIFFISSVLADVELRSLTLTGGNAAGDSGGAIAAVNAGSLHILDTTISGNNANSGGGVATFGTALTVANSLITGNSAAYGGGIYSQNASVTLQNTTVTGNAVTGFGGGISSLNGSLGLFNTTVADNHADTDGASTGSGGGIRTGGTNYSVLYNSAVADNFSGTGLVEHNVFGTVNFAGNSAFGDGAAIGINGGGNLLNIATAGLGILADNGGTVRTLAIETGSVLIGAGSTTRISADSLDIDHDGSTSEPLQIDGRGGPRQIGQVDIGAVEARAPLVVTTAADDAFGGGNLAAETLDGGGLSLREAMAFANADGTGDTITFDAILAGQTLTLTGGDLDITSNVIVDGDTNGDNRADITISGGGVSRIFDLQAGSNADILSLTLTNGYVSASQGAGIYARSGSTLDIVDTTIRNCTIFADMPGDQANGGGIASRGTLTVTNSTITGNSGQDGGGVFVTGTATFVNATISGNSAQDIQLTGGFGGGIAAVGATLTILNSTVTGNVASYQAGGISLVNGTAAITNSIVASNTGAVAPVDIGGTGLTAQNSFFGSYVTIGTDLGGNINNGGDPLLGQLLDNGGTTLTRSPLDGSVLIGAGGSLSIEDLFDLDRDGNRRESLPLDARSQPRVNGVRDIGAVEQIVDEIIRGTAGSDTIIGGLGQDRLIGGAGIDTMNGGAGNDIIEVDAAGDIIIEAIGGGFDTVRSTVTYSLAAGVEVERLSTSATGGTGAINLTGNAFAQEIYGNNGANTLNGGIDALRDILTGYGGNDIYVINSALDIIVEGVGNGTADRVQTSLTFTLAADDNIEIFQTTNAALTTAINLSGNGVSQAIYGNAGVNTLSGGIDALSDTLIGYGGNDIYVIHSANDLIVEGVGQGASDRVQATVSFALAADDNIEIMQTTNAGFTTLINLTGNVGGQAIYGNAAVNVLNGGLDSARDTLIGYGGNDTYVINSTADLIVEGVGAGTADRAQTSVTFTLAADDNIEIFETTNAAGTLALGLTGNANVQSITGNAGGNTLNGGLGNDTLTGLGGADRFLFNTALDTLGNADVILDFSVADDTIQLENAIFTLLASTGTLAANLFEDTSLAGQNGSEVVVYDRASGAIYYDTNGAATADGLVLFAEITDGTLLTNTDFFVV